jgi:heme exporter protein B
MSAQAGTARAFMFQVGRDLRLAARRWEESGNPLVFFVIVITLFPLALGAEHSLLERFAPGVLWVAALLAMLLAQESVFRSDFDDGSLEQIALSPQPLWLLVLAKVAAHWLLTGLPLVLLAPIAADALYLPRPALPTLILALLLGTWLLSMLGAVGAALTVGLHRGGVLLAILVLPLAVPTLVLGTRATDMAGAGLDPQGPLYWMAALLAMSASLAPFGAAAALRIHLE